MEIRSAKVEDFLIITELYEDLIKEICEKTNTELILLPQSQTLELCKSYLESETYRIFVVEMDKKIVGFISLCSSHSLYAGGEFGIIQEFFVRPAFRSKNVGSTLLAKATEYGKKIGWKRLEVSTPPVPQFDKSFLFYKNNRFVDSGGRKMKLVMK
jgi:GNAT superfamily N-acetyltransferase